MVLFIILTYLLIFLFGETLFHTLILDTYSFLHIPYTYALSSENIFEIADLKTLSNLLSAGSWGVSMMLSSHVWAMFPVCFCACFMFYVFVECWKF